MTARFRPTAVPKGDSKKQRFDNYLAREKPERITQAVWEALARELAPISETYLRELARSSGLPLDPLLERVRQDSLESLERTLLQLQREYEGGGEQEKRRCRDCVIEAKDHARWAARKMPEDDPRRALKEEMLLWLLTWLENPGAFPLWVALRKHSTLKA